MKPLNKEIVSNISRIKTQTIFEVNAIIKNGEQLLVSIIFPVLVLFLLNFSPILDSYLENKTNLQRIDIAFPAILSLCIVSTAFTGQGIATGFDRRYAVIKLLSTTPLGKIGLVFGKITAVFTIVTAQFCIMTIIAISLGWSHNISAIGITSIISIIGIITFTTLGLILAGTLRAEANLAVINLSWVLFASLGGLMYPNDYLPGAIKNVINIFPPAILGNMMRESINFNHINFLNLILLSIWGILGSLACIKWFKWNA